MDRKVEKSNYKITEKNNNIIYETNRPSMTQVKRATAAAIVKYSKIYDACHINTQSW